MAGKGGVPPVKLLVRLEVKGEILLQWLALLRSRSFARLAAAAACMAGKGVPPVKLLVRLERVVAAAACMAGKGAPPVKLLVRLKPLAVEAAGKG